jgi:twinkle protein
MIQEFLTLGIQPRGNQIQQKIKCPKCIGDRKHKEDLSLSINLQNGVFKCHHCNWQGKVGNLAKGNFNMDGFDNSFYSLPNEDNLIQITNQAREFLNSRGITNEVIDNNNVKSSKNGENIVFTYYKEGKLVNYKTRGINEKTFSQFRNGEPVMYNYDGLIGKENVIICEGEIDSLSWEVAGCTYHTSVNMGAPNPQDKSVDKKLQCLDGAYEIFRRAKNVYISVDNDENGRFLQRELIRRIGAEKCKLIDLSPFKDANEVLVHEGKESLVERFKSALYPKVEGIFEVEDIRDSLIDGFYNGVEEGTTTYVPQIDNAWRWRPGEVNIWTGYQNEGKSTFLNQLACVKAAMEGWKFAVFSPENMPMNDFVNELIEMYIGKTTNPTYKSLQMDIAEYEEGLKFVNDHFFLIYPSKGFLLETVLEKTKILIRQRGINSLIIDPYNTIQHKMRSGEREDLYISRFMSDLKKFAVDNHISVHLVAHQVTPRKGDDGRYPKPDVNYIKGGGTFADKADNVMFVWRPFRAIDFSNKLVTFGSQKIKKQRLVGIPQDIENIEFDIKECRYYFNNFTPFTKIDEIRRNKRSTPIIASLHNRQEQ